MSTAAPVLHPRCLAVTSTLHEMITAQPLNILVVESDETQRKLLVELISSLTGQAERVWEAADGAQALEVLQTQQPPVDLVWYDIQQPGIDGLALSRKIAELPRRPAVVLISALETSIQEAAQATLETYGLEVLGLARKPPSRSQIVRLIDKHLARRQQIREAQKAPAVPQLQADAILAGLQRNEFVAYFQPQVDCVSGNVVGMEALARWNHPSLGLLSPQSFLTQLKAHHLTHHLTWIMLAKASAAAQAWKQQGLDLKVYINVTVGGLAREGVTEQILKVVKQYGADPRMLVLELTESEAVAHVGPALENLIRLRLMGFGLCIDDFGTGDSAIHQLSRIPFTEIKIDKSFIDDCLEQETMRVIVASSIRIGHELGLLVTAEGVSRVEQWVALRRMGCDTAQGYLIAQPMPMADVLPWVRGWRGDTTHAWSDPLHAKNILLVMDRSTERERYVEALASRNFGRIDTASTLSEALYQLRRPIYDAVVVAAEVGKDKGLDLVLLIRTRKTALRPGVRLFVLLARSDPDTVKECVALEVNGILLASMKKDEFVRQIELAVGEDFYVKTPEQYEQALDRLPSAPARHASASIILSEFENGREGRRRGRRVHLDDLEPNMVLGESIYSIDDKLILSAGHALSLSVIQSLRRNRERLSSSFIWIQPAQEQRKT